VPVAAVSRIREDDAAAVRVYDDVVRGVETLRPLIRIE
jgi:hypothetical protein